MTRDHVIPPKQSDTPLRHIGSTLLYDRCTNGYVGGLRTVIYCALPYLIFMLHAGILIQSLYKGLEVSAYFVFWDKL